MAGQPWLLYFKTLFGSVFCDDQVHTLCIPLSTISPLGGEPCSFILYPQSTDHPNSWVALNPFALKPGTTHKIWITRSTAQPFVKSKWGTIFLFYSNFLYFFLPVFEIVRTPLCWGIGSLCSNLSNLGYQGRLGRIFWYIFWYCTIYFWRSFCSLLNSVAVSFCAISHLYGERPSVQDNYI